MDMFCRGWPDYVPAGGQGERQQGCEARIRVRGRSLSRSRRQDAASTLVRQNTAAPFVRATRANGARRPYRKETYDATIDVMFF
jgi:hypothetical protein